MVLSRCEWVGERRLRRTSITPAHWELWAVCAKECAVESLFCAFSPRAPSPLGKDFVLAEKCGVRGKHKCAEIPNTNLQECQTQICRNAKQCAEMPNTIMKKCKTSLVCRNGLCWWVNFALINIWYKCWRESWLYPVSDFLRSVSVTACINQAACSNAEIIQGLILQSVYQCITVLQSLYPRVGITITQTDIMMTLLYHGAPRRWVFARQAGQLRGA